MVEEVVSEVLGQRAAPVRFEWGPTGAASVSEPDGCLVVVDVLSFTTAVSVATGRGVAVYPYPLGARGADTFAAAHGAELAVRRREATPERPWSLSPAALDRAPVVPGLVLPSPNGSAIAAAATGTIVAGCLRNASAVAAWALEHGYGGVGRPIAVVAAGERWPDGSLRPAVEDALGAGAVLSRLRAAGLSLSAEAEVAATALERAPDVIAAIWGCGSALELMGLGFHDDVHLALEPDVDDHVPVLQDEAFRAQ